MSMLQAHKVFRWGLLIPRSGTGMDFPSQTPIGGDGRGEAANSCFQAAGVDSSASRRCAEDVSTSAEQVSNS